MKKYHSVEVPENEIEDLIRRDPELVEVGLKYVDHQAFTARGPLDVLLVDSGSSLVVAELKASEDDGMLVQGIDYYDYVVRNLEGFARAYDNHEIDPVQEPRLFLIAPSFSVTLLNRIKWINIPISLFTINCIEFEDEAGEIIPVYKELTPPAKQEKVEAYSLEDRYSYIVDKGVRKLARSFTSQVQSLDEEMILVEPTKYDISMKLAGRIVAVIAPRRQHFMVYTNDEEGQWTGYPINNQTDLEPVWPIVNMNYQRITGGD